MNGEGIVELDDNIAYQEIAFIELFQLISRFPAFYL